VVKRPQPCIYTAPAPVVTRSHPASKKLKYYDVYYDCPRPGVGNETTIWVEVGDEQVQIDVCHFRVRARSYLEAEDKAYSILARYISEDHARRPEDYTVVRVQENRKATRTASDIKQYRSLGFSDDEIKELMAKEAELVARNRRKAKPTDDGWTNLEHQVERHEEAAQ
jgi:hypothetical protein